MNRQDNVECYVQGVIQDEFIEKLMVKLRGISQEESSFKFQEFLFQHPRAKEMGEQRVRMNLEPKKYSIHSSYKPSMVKDTVKTAVRIVHSVPVSENIAQFLQDMGYKLISFFTNGGFLIKCNVNDHIIHATISKIGKNNIDEPLDPEVQKFSFVEIWMESSPEAMQQTAEDLMDFASQLSNLVELGKYDHSIKLPPK